MIPFSLSSCLSKITDALPSFICKTFICAYIYFLWSNYNSHLARTSFPPTHTYTPGKQSPIEFITSCQIFSARWFCYGVWDKLSWAVRMLLSLSTSPTRPKSSLLRLDFISFLTELAPQYCLLNEWILAFSSTCFMILNKFPKMSSVKKTINVYHFKWLSFGSVFAMF